MPLQQSQKAEGFPGQRIVILPWLVVTRAATHPLLRGVLPTDAGYFPQARGHFRDRPEGVDQAIFIYCVKGAGWCELNGRRVGVGAGDLLVIPPNTPHAYGADENRPWTIHWLHVTGLHVTPFLEELAVTLARPVCYLGDDSQPLALFEEVLESVEHGYTPAHLLYASQALAHLLSVMVRRRRESWRGKPDAGQKISQSIAYMKEHLQKPLRVQTLAAIINLSPARYSELFKTQTGYAPIDYFIRLRMHHACQLLDTTEFSIKSIAVLVGYEDQLYFSRIFHKLNDASPRDYRRRQKG